MRNLSASGTVLQDQLLSPSSIVTGARSLRAGAKVPRRAAFATQEITPVQRTVTGITVR